VIKLLIVDDSALMRKLLEQIFQEEGDFEVHVARNGAQAMDAVRSFDPHVVTLDVQMPEMDGIACLSQIMLEGPRPVVMISALTGDGAETTLEALELGAVDFVAKPSGAVSLEIDRLRPIIVEKVRGAAQVRMRRTIRLTERIRHQLRRTPEAEAAKRVRPQIKPEGRAKPSPGTGLVLIGSSTGGPVALDIVLPQFPADFPWPVMVAQHMPAGFTATFAKRLDRLCALQVVEVSRPVPLTAGTIYIARGDADITVARRSGDLMAMSVPLKKDYPWHPSVERMVTSALEHYDAHCLVGVMLTGMGRDGADAMTRLRERGGRTVAEAESTATVWGMPGELVKAGGAEFVRPIEDVTETVLQMVGFNALC
jgi:two-component system chemotaxis response regulator CheB